MGFSVKHLFFVAVPRKTESTKTKNIYSKIHKIHDITTPCHKKYTLMIDPVGLPDHHKDKALIAMIDGKQVALSELNEKAASCCAPDSGCC